MHTFWAFGALVPMKLGPPVTYPPFEAVFLFTSTIGHDTLILLQLLRVHRSTPVVGVVETKRTGLEEKDFSGNRSHTALVSCDARRLCFLAPSKS